MIRGAAVVLVLASVVMAVRGFVVSPYRVGSSSMNPTLSEGDIVLVEKLSPRLRGLDRGDVVALHGPDGVALVKRVVGVGGDRVAIADSALVVNGRVVREDYVDHSRIDATYFGPVSVPPGHVFVMGDDRAGSIDSRDFGPVPVADVHGTVITVLVQR